MSIAISPKYGVNPSRELCLYCLEPRGVVPTGHLTKTKAEKLFGKELASALWGDELDLEAPRQIIMDHMPCEKCADYMEKGIILISVNEELTTNVKNPHRSGAWVVVKEDYIRRVIETPELMEAICRQRMAFIPDAAWDMLGLPRGAVKEEAGDG